MRPRQGADVFFLPFFLRRGDAGPFRAFGAAPLRPTCGRKKRRPQNGSGMRATAEKNGEKTEKQRKFEKIEEKTSGRCGQKKEKREKNYGEIKLSNVINGLTKKVETVGS